jgi:hypothetical protein
MTGSLDQMTGKVTVELEIAMVAQSNVDAPVVDHYYWTLDTEKERK